MKGISSILLSVLVLAIGCSEDDQPRFRVRNDRSTKANVQIKTSGGNTININDVEPGALTGYQNAAAGIIEATATIQNESVSPTTVFVSQNNHSYTIIVANSSPPSLGFISP